MNRHARYFLSGVAVVAVAGAALWFWLSHFPARTTVSIFFGGSGTGSVTGPGGLISCSSDCTTGGLFGSITLTATPSPTSLFAGWGGPVCSGTNPTCDVTLSQPARVIAYFRSSSKTVAAGAYHTCALRAAGDVRCWGKSDDGQLGTGNTNVHLGMVSSITNAVAIAAGGYHTCALIAGGTVQCWGNNQLGQAGVFTFGTDVSVPTVVVGITEAVAITAGGYHTCVVNAGGSASCWGNNGNGQLGSNTRFDHWPAPIAVQLSAVGSITNQIAAGGFHTCAIVAADSTVVCWGMNNYGQLGLGNTSNAEGAAGPRVQIEDPGCGGDPTVGCAGTTTFLTATQIAASIGVGQDLFGDYGGFHTVSIDSTGQDWGWGSNSDGQIFRPHVWPAGLSAYSTAHKDNFFTNPRFLKIAAGANHTCMLGVYTANVFCVGNNSNKQSGPSPTGGEVPMTVFSVDLAAGGFHTCSVEVDSSTPSDGAVLCWGQNGFGQVSGVPGGDVTNPVVVPIP